MDASFFDGLTIFLSLTLAVILGGLLGTERSLAHKHAGMRTFALVSLASAFFVVIGQLVIQETDIYSNADPLRIASQVVLGIGFLGSGLIILQNKTVNGLTTAAGLWVAAGLGMACAFGFYYLALFVTALALFVFRGLLGFEEKVRRIK